MEPLVLIYSHKAAKFSGTAPPPPGLGFRRKLEGSMMFFTKVACGVSCVPRWLGFLLLRFKGTNFFNGKKREKKTSRSTIGIFDHGKSNLSTCLASDTNCEMVGCPNGVPCIKLRGGCEVNQVLVQPNQRYPPTSKLAIRGKETRRP